MYYGGIEAGGTKMVCAVADSQATIVALKKIPTTTPEETIQAMFDFFDHYSLAALGIGSFGPIGIDPKRKNYGYILKTPKKGWSNVDILGPFQKRYNVPCVFTTDVNAAAYGELQLGAAKGLTSCIYLTVGTGIGAGVVIDKKIFQGNAHPEMGHIRIKRHPEDMYEGTCPYHKDCLEGLAAGPSLEKRTGIKGQNLPSTHPVWTIQAYYLAQALMNYTLSFSPDRIILGGGVMNQEHLLTKIKTQFVKEMNGYGESKAVDDYIVPWQLVNQSGIMGCLLLAINAA